MAISPDSETVAFVGAKASDRQLYVRRLDQGETVPFGRVALAANAVAFSPEGLSTLLMFNDGTLRRAFLKDR
ncbi:MAG: hypothetical protein ACRD2N_14600 [Vicinamibacterales bacterium]